MMFTKKFFNAIWQKLDNIETDVNKDKVPYELWKSTRTLDELYKARQENIKLCSTISEMTAKCEDYDRMKNQHQSLIDEIDFLYNRCNRLQQMLVDVNYFIKESDNNG